MPNLLRKITIAIAGHIVANLTANTTGWTSGLRGAIGPLQAIAGVITGMAAAAVSRFSTFGDEIDKMRARTGLTAVELSQLSHAAGLSDTSLGSLQSGLTKMQKFLRETASGSKSARATLDELGVSAAELGSMTNGEKLGRFADALMAIPDPGERAAVAMEIFGKGAVDLLPLLAGGSAGLAEMAAEADRLGITLSDEAADNAALLNDTIGRLTGTVGALFTTVGSQLAPMIISVVSGFTEWVGRNRDLIVLLAKTAIVISSVVIAMKFVTLATQAYATAQAVAAALSGPAGWAKLAIGLAVAGAAATVLATQFESANSATSAAQGKISAAAGEYDSLAESATVATVAVKDYSSVMSGMTTAYESFIPKADQVRNKLNQMTSDWWAADAAGQAASITITQLEGVKLKTILGESGWKSEFDTVGSELAVLRGEITATEQRFAEMAEFGVDTRHIDALRAMNVERDKLLKDQLAKEQAAEAEKRKLTDVTARVHDSQNTAYGDFAREVSAVEDAIKAGNISEGEGLRYLEQKRKEFLDAEKQAGAQKLADMAEPAKKQASNVGIDARSSQANQMIVDLVNRRGTPQNNTVADKQLLVQQAQLAADRQTAALLQDIRDESRRKEELRAKPFSARGRT